MSSDSHGHPPQRIKCEGPPVHSKKGIQNELGKSKIQAGGNKMLLLQLHRYTMPGQIAVFVTGPED